MEWNELQTAWQTYQAMQRLDGIPEKQLNNIIDRELQSSRAQVKTPILQYVLAHTLLLLICQSC